MFPCMFVHISHPHLSLFSSPVVTVVFEAPTYTVTETVGDAQVCLRKDLETAVPFQVETFTDDRSAMSRCIIDLCISTTETNSNDQCYYSTFMA